MPHNTLYRYTIAELTTGVLSYCSLHHHDTVLGTVAGVMVMGLSHRACPWSTWFRLLAVVSGSPSQQSYPPPEDKTDWDVYRSELGVSQDRYTTM
jgi:hypothetical protein